MDQKKRVLILGNRGFIGKALHHFLVEKGYEVAGVDNLSRIKFVQEVGSESLVPPEPSMENPSLCLDITDYQALYEIIKDFQPEAIVHLAEQPSAPFSMIDAKHCAETQSNNIVGSLNLLWAVHEINPNIHIIKLGTAGEYPDWLWGGRFIPEGHRMTVQYRGEDWEIPVPRYAGSWYHFSKLHDSINLDYACRIWGLKATDVNQGVIYGHRYNTRFDYDESFGTLVHRFVVQAVKGLPLTVYGEGGQTRGFINLQNAIEAIELFIKNPPVDEGLRVAHQLTNTYSVMDIANKVQELTDCEIEKIPNPRAELPRNTFDFEARILKDLGLQTITLEEELPNLIELAQKYKDEIREEVIRPKINWR